MRLSFDTEQDKLDEALAVLSAAYGVTVSRERSTGTRARRATKAAASSRSRSRKPARQRTTASTRSRATTARKSTGRKAVANHSTNGAVRTSDVRAWATTQGIKVSDRGRLSAALIAEYVAATA